MLQKASWRCGALGLAVGLVGASFDIRSEFRVGLRCRCLREGAFCRWVGLILVAHITAISGRGPIQGLRYQEHTLRVLGYDLCVSRPPGFREVLDVGIYDREQRESFVEAKDCWQLAQAQRRPQPCNFRVLSFRRSRGYRFRG